jgi:hypothetical protein
MVSQDEYLMKKYFLKQLQASIDFYLIRYFILLAYYQVFY